MRGIAAAFLVMCLAALRGIDAQRSSFDGEHATGSGYAFFSAVAWNSKGKVSMPWACPMRVFDDSTDWYEALRFVWREFDFLFPSVAPGTPLASAAGFTDRPATPYMVLRYLREIVCLYGFMSAEEAARLRRHSFRHFVPNCVRLLKFDLPDSFQSGRWKDHHIMPLRYAGEVKFMAMVDIIVRVIAACAEALQRVEVVVTGVSLSAGGGAGYGAVSVRCYGF